MNILKTLTWAMLVTPLALGTVGCEKKGPAEKAGEKVDEAADNAGDKVEEAADKVGGKVEEVGDEIEDAVE